MARTISEGMQANYDARRKHTLKLIKDEIREMRNNGEVISKKLLMERTGLSSGTFSKAHVKDLLKQEEVCQFAPKYSPGLEEYFRERRSTLVTDKNRMEKKIQALEDKISDLKRQKEAVEKELKQEQDVNKRLRGENQHLRERMFLAGVPFRTN